MPLFTQQPVIPTLNPAIAVGRYVNPISPNTATTAAALGNGSLRLAPFWSPVPFAIDRLGGDIATVGEAGSKLRCTIFLDNGFAYPGDLLIDAGQIAGDSATVQDLIVSTVIPAGLTWWGGAVQSAPTTQPVVRATNALTPAVPLLLGTAIPGANALAAGYLQTGVSGAAPSTFTTSISNAPSAPRLHCRISAWG